MVFAAKQIENPKPQDKQYRMTDSEGFCLEAPPTVTSVGGFAIELSGKGSIVSLGARPEATLKVARAKRDECKREIRERAEKRDQVWN